MLRSGVVLGTVLSTVLLASGCAQEMASDDAAIPTTDAGVLSDAGPSVDDAGRADAGLPPSDAGPPTPDAGPPPVPPNEVFFVGNSFTFGGPVPVLVHDLAVYAGYPEPNVEYRAIGGQTLEGHRADRAADGAPARVAEGWDVVVLQELSTRPTDQIGPAERFKADATWFYDLAKTANEDCEIILYETWARRAGHPIYDSTFTDPAQMQAELRFHYNDAADRYIPMFATSARASDVRVAPAGDAWELQLAAGEPPILHASDDYHASAAGQYLNALVIYSTIYHRRADGLVPLRGLDEPTAAMLQGSADAVTGATGWGPVYAVVPMASAAEVRVDVGPLMVAGWSWLGATDQTIGPVSTVDGASTSVLVTAWGFSGVQEGGATTNGLGLPADVSRDSLWVGSFDGHAAALALEARAVIRGLAPDGHYRVEIFASRDGSDGSNGRLSRYTIGAASVDLDVANNTDRVAAFDDVTVDARGEVLIRIGVSPDGGARFAYLGAIRVTRVD
ncbi:MAG: hypothetical protein AB7S26_21060 [Sandaracinaceae bacterium]